jgi:hypothetical protein
MEIFLVISFRDYFLIYALYEDISVAYLAFVNELISYFALPLSVEAFQELEGVSQ